MIVELRPVKFSNVPAGSFESNIPRTMTSRYTVGNIVGIHVVSDINASVTLFFCKRSKDISSDTVDDSSIITWVDLTSPTQCPAGLYHLQMPKNQKIPFATSGYAMSDLKILLRNNGSSTGNFKVYVTVAV